MCLLANHEPNTAMTIGDWVPYDIMPKYAYVSAVKVAFEGPVFPPPLTRAKFEQNV